MFYAGNEQLDTRMYSHLQVFVHFYLQNHYWTETFLLQWWHLRGRLMKFDNFSCLYWMRHCLFCWDVAMYGVPHCLDKMHYIVWHCLQMFLKSITMDLDHNFEDIEGHFLTCCYTKYIILCINFQIKYKESTISAVMPIIFYWSIF